MIYVLCILLYHPNSEATPNSKITGAYSVPVLCTCTLYLKPFVLVFPLIYRPCFVLLSTVVSVSVLSFPRIFYVYILLSAFA